MAATQPSLPSSSGQSDALSQSFGPAVTSRRKHWWFPRQKKQAPWMEDPHPAVVILKGLTLASIVLVMLFPFVNVVATSFSSYQDVLTSGDIHVKDVVRRRTGLRARVVDARGLVTAVESVEYGLAVKIPLHPPVSASSNQQLAGPGAGDLGKGVGDLSGQGEIGL